ncbi:hypothetical protein GALMADRAFT_147287 [Galerina marginata CBS 339.88]|uniref:Uncharacterized protein n=1 Tax=Galerina marginata (strain CBS 339.88) TaxID=685588 RepID=A0A067SBG3_GALM3|nr:hypothetical protein GALMADRAFT_147287 [Galerina marginata CBS 339.88]
MSGGLDPLRNSKLNEKYVHLSNHINIIPPWKCIKDQLRRLGEPAFKLQFPITLLITAMFASRALFALVSSVAALSSVNAYTGRATWDSLGTTPCPVQCPLTDYRVALPSTLFPNGDRCCSKVYVSYNGVNIAVTFTDLFLAGANSFNISLSDKAFAQLAPLEVGQISPVVWNL